MQATADGAGTRTRAAPDERRPVRLLVPTEKRTMWYVPEKDTLRAADLGLSRDTDERQLLRMVPGAREMLHTAGLNEDPEAYLRRIRDALRHPRDIDDARAWNMIVPEDENAEEFDPDRTKRTGWWWVLDPARTETRDERETRLLADTRLIDMKGAARILRRRYITVKDFKVESDRIRRMLLDAAFLRSEAAKLVDRQARKGIILTLDAAIADQLAYANKNKYKAMPPRRDRNGQSDVWYVADICRNGRDTTRLTEWYEFNRVLQTGRPPGSKTIHRRPHASAPAAEQAQR
jgi:hypothetical protein